MASSRSPSSVRGRAACSFWSSDLSSTCLAGRVAGVRELLELVHNRLGRVELDLQRVRLLSDLDYVVGHRLQLLLLCELRRMRPTLPQAGRLGRARLRVEVVQLRVPLIQLVFELCNGCLSLLLDLGPDLPSAWPTARSPSLPQARPSARAGQIDWQRFACSSPRPSPSPAAPAAP
jgi:hypothetical protein